MMNTLTDFFKNVFLATGAIWFFSALAILVLNLNFGPKEIAFTIILPFAWAVVRLFDRTETIK
jgi:hypothetical protein